MALEKDPGDDIESVSTSACLPLFAVVLVVVTVLGLIVLGFTSNSRNIDHSSIRAQGARAETLGIPVTANPELTPHERRLWLEGFMAERREHLRKMGMLRSGDSEDD